MALLGLYRAVSCLLPSIMIVHCTASLCPDNYIYRVEMCVMEAQVAPQAGGGLSVVMDINTLDKLCKRGILQKTIDCLNDIHLRCADNVTRKQELDMLFNVNDWKRGQELLCEDMNLFRNNFDCMSKFGPRMSSCILIRTQLFKRAATKSDLVHFKSFHDMTCNFAENIVNCLAHPLLLSCPVEVVSTLIKALHRFLPPACSRAPVEGSQT